MIQRIEHVAIRGTVWGYFSHTGCSELYITPHCNGNSVYVLLFWELRGLSLNFHIYVSVSDLYIPRIGPHIFSTDPSWEYIIHMNVEIGTDTPIFLFWEYLFQIFGILSLQCGESSYLEEYAKRCSAKAPHINLYMQMTSRCKLLQLLMSCIRKAIDKGSNQAAFQCTIAEC
jgi:hypothetical protein